MPFDSPIATSFYSAKSDADVEVMVTEVSLPYPYCTGQCKQHFHQK